MSKELNKITGRIKNISNELFIIESRYCKIAGVEIDYKKISDSPSRKFSEEARRGDDIIDNLAFDLNEPF